MNQQTYYKVARKVRDGIYKSAVICGSDLVYYILNAWVESPFHLKENNLHLLLFDNYIDALNFKNTELKRGIILKCNAKSILKNIPAPNQLYYRRHYNTSFEGWHIDLYHKYSKWPKGTIMAKKVMVLEEVG